MPLKNALRALGQVLLLMLVVYVVVWAITEQDHGSEHDIPVPPSGYEYCTTDADTIGYCPKGTP